MKSSEAVKKAVDFYKSNGLAVIHMQDGVSPRLIAYDRGKGELVFVVIRRPRNKSYKAHKRSCRNAISSLLAWHQEWVKTNSWKGSVRLESIAVYEDGEMDSVFHRKDYVFHQK